MDNKFAQSIRITVFILCSGLASFGQRIDFSSVNYKKTQIILHLNNIKVIISQNKPLKMNRNIPYCNADIKIYEHNNLIDSLIFAGIQPVGDNYGLLVFSDPIMDHILIAKFGDYDGKTIIINKKGQVFLTIGGYIYIDKSNGLLFSIYASDLSGFSIFDLKSDKEIMNMKEIKERPHKFYKGSKNKYHCSLINDITKNVSIWEIDLSIGKMTPTSLNVNDLKNNPLEILSDFKHISVNCE